MEIAGDAGTHHQDHLRAAVVNNGLVYSSQE